MEHLPHWSGAHCHECFVRQVMTEPHPLDYDPTFQDLINARLDMLMLGLFPKPKMRDNLPEHYKKAGK
jgi:hypothetical protein